MEMESSNTYQVIAYATEKHAGQKRKNSAKDPYIVHPMDVMVILSTNGIQDRLALFGAILHDTIEDTTATYEEIAEKFGADLADVVAEVTDDKSLAKEVRKRRQADNIAGKSFAARAIKIGDKMSNCHDLLEDPPSGWDSLQINGYIAWSWKVCQNAMSVGDIPKELVQAVEGLFTTLGVHDMPEETLELYYASLR